MTLPQTKGTRSKSSGKPCFESLDEAIAVDSPPIAQPHEVAFWLIAYVFAATMLGTTLPTPLYVIWESQWHFSSGTVTLIFAVYAAGAISARLRGTCLRPGRAKSSVGAHHELAFCAGRSQRSIRRRTVWAPRRYPVGHFWRDRGFG